MTTELEEQVYYFIPLTRGLSALVDAINYEYLNQFNWFAVKGNKTFYAARNIRKTNGKQTHIYMHILIMGQKDGCIIDHFDGNGLNNRRQNLRYCTYSQNQQNSQWYKSKPRYSSKYKGVRYHSGKNDKQRKKKWDARIMYQRKAIFLGSFVTEREAALAYNDAAYQYFGEFANPNIL